MRAKFMRTASPVLAFGAPDLLAPESFRAHLKNQYPNLECWWNPFGHRAVTVKGKPYNIPGCWSIWQPMVIAEQLAGLPMKVAREWWVCVFMVSGAHGEDTELGSWVTHALKHADMTKRGNQRRREELDALAYETAMKRSVDLERKQDEVANDRIWRRVMGGMNDRLGMHVKSGDDRKRYAKEEAGRRARYAAKAEAAAREAQIFGGR